MAKRRLNHQQLRRISQNQQQRGKRAQVARDQLEDPLAHDELGPELPGIVVCHYGQQLDIESQAEESRGQIFRCYQRSNLPALVTGDRVTWQAAAELTGVVVALEPRRTVLHRPNAQGDLRPVAANIDCVVVVIAPVPEPFANLIDRYLVAIENIDLEPVLLLNKEDLLEDSQQPWKSCCRPTAISVTRCCAAPVKPAVVWTHCSSIFVSEQPYLLGSLALVSLHL